MPLFALVNQKGGSAKSTTAVHTVHMAIRRKKRVLLIDLDKQGSASDFFEATPGATGIGASSLFLGPLDGEVEHVSEYLDIIRADEPLANIADAGPDAARQAAANMRTLSGGYDLAVIDTAGALGKDATVIAALLAADYVLCPFGIGRFEAKALTALWGYLNGIRQRENTRLKILGLLPSKINSKSKAELDGLATIREQLGEMVTPFTLVERVSVKKAVMQGRPVWHATKGQGHAQAASEWLQACAWTLDKMGVTQ